jgi:hypothetical protein
MKANSDATVVAGLQRSARTTKEQTMCMKYFDVKSDACVFAYFVSGTLTETFNNRYKVEWTF